jgi:chemotaxis family two-component system sensor kinase Cph1
MINAPFGDCKNADLHLADSIQSYGALLAVHRPSGRIAAVSANAQTWLGQEPRALLGQDWRQALPADVRDGSLAAPSQEAFPAPGLRAFSQGGRSLIAAVHQAGDYEIVELESGVPPSFGVGSETLAWGMAALAAADTEQAAAEALMQAVARITGYDRVMLYQFLPGWHGKVVAEVLRPGVGGFLGLHFPASDVPANARRLYLVKRQRVIAHVSDPPVPILAAVAGTEIDLTSSELRAVHPVHIQYLQNLGVEASFSVSVLVAGHLWGLIACHHLAPRRVSFASRQWCEQIATVASIHMTDLQRLSFERARHHQHTARSHARLELQTVGGGKQVIAIQLARFREAFAAQGAWAYLDDQSHFSGDVPDEASLSILKNWLDTYDRRRVSACAAIPPSLEKYPALARFASGLLYLPLTDQDFVLLMRAEQVENVSWAGKPRDDADSHDPLLELTPRTSFQVWSELTHGQALPWLDTDLEGAALLREMLIEHIERIRLERLALSDPLTGLCNRAMFERKLQEAVTISLRDEVLSAVLMIDLDRFKPVNDQYGHAAGDALLVQVAERLRQQVRGRDVVARLGGDEFAIIQFHVASIRDVDAIATRVLEALRKPYEVLGHTVEIGASIGASVCPQHAAEQDSLMHRADLALYQVKREGRNGFQLFDQDMLPNDTRPSSLREELTAAIEGNGLHFVYQPILHARTGSLQALEALVRWNHPRRGCLSGTEVMGLIEQFRLSTAFAYWGLGQVVRQARQWHRMGHDLVPISINMSALQFLDADLAARCAELARELDFSLEWLRFEVEETVLQADLAQVAPRIQGLSALGVLTQIDHFGRGLLPLLDLPALQVSRLKINASLLQKRPVQEGIRPVAALVCSVAKALNIPVIVTRIDDEEMLREVNRRDFELVQGHAVAPLLEVAEVPDWLSHGGRPS